MRERLLYAIYLRQTLILLAIAGAAIISGCGSFSGESAASATGSEITSPFAVPEDDQSEPLVRFTTIEPGAFNRELISNGTLSARTKAVIEFELDGSIENVYVKEGDRVAAGQQLALIERTTYQRNLEQKELQLTRARLDFEDLLLRMGYKLQDTASLARDVLKMARIRSGLDQAMYERETAEEELASTVVRAPFSGLIADVRAQPYNSTSVSGGRLCTLIDDRRLTVEFPVLESELEFVRRSKTVTVSLFGDSQHDYQGTVVSVNPQVDANGMVQVKASVNNSGHRLLDGMNVRVALGQSVADQLVVPKEAVLDRQGRKVVFTYEDSVAKWNYVEVGLENSTQYTIASGLEAGDKVIYEGNFNLAHDKPVGISEAE